MNLYNESKYEIKIIRHNYIVWFFKNPLKLIKYYVLLRKIAKANKGKNYDCPTLDWYMNNKK